MEGKTKAQTLIDMQEKSYEAMDKIRAEIEQQESDPREKDLRELCRKVLSVMPNVSYNPNGADTSTCPFCYKHVNYSDAEMSDIKHSPDCATLIAKDLMTGINPQHQ